jgi:hypothetical protein
MTYYEQQPLLEASKEKQGLVDICGNKLLGKWVNGGFGPHRWRAPQGCHTL